jgi:hypothetical protein
MVVEPGQRVTLLRSRMPGHQASKDEAVKTHRTASRELGGPAPALNESKHRGILAIDVRIDGLFSDTDGNQ